MNAFTHVKAIQKGLLTVGLLVIGWQTGWAQFPETGPQPTHGNDQTLRSTVASYRDDVRQSVLLASRQPPVLTAIARQRAGSEQAFVDLIQTYGQTKQGWFYDLVRYPDVLHQLATLPARSDRSAVDAVTKGLPADLQESAWKVYRHHHADLVQVDNLNQQAQQGFDALIAPLDAPTQQAFRQLLAMPDVLTQLTDQIDQTTQLGEAYRANPDSVANNLTALHDSLTVQNQRELAAYQSELDKDPQARQELQQAGQDYARANGYRTDGINPNPAWPNPTTYAYANPYPFWFGYPYWYASPVWYPSAWWYGTGFYFGPGGNLALFGMPSFGFSNWFFGSGRYLYPHLYNRFNNYYVYNMGQRHSLTPGNAGFMTAAHRALGSVNGFGNARANWLTRSGQYNRLNSGLSTGRLSAPGVFTPGASTRGGFRGANMGGYRAPVGGMRTYSGGGFRGGSIGGFHGGFGGGFHGGRH